MPNLDATTDFGRSGPSMVLWSSDARKKNLLLMLRNTTIHLQKLQIYQLILQTHHYKHHLRFFLQILCNLPPNGNKFNLFYPLIKIALIKQNMRLHSH